MVAPSLPGYGLSFQPGQPRFGTEEMAEAFAELMTDVLGYQRFGCQGGDWGASISTVLGHRYPERVIGIHLNLLVVRRDPKLTLKTKTYLRTTQALPARKKPATRRSRAPSRRRSPSA